MNHLPRCPKPNLTATLLSLGLLVDSFSSSASHASLVSSANQAAKLLSQPGRYAQAPAATVSQPRLKLDGVLDEKSNAFENGRWYNIHTFEGKAGEKLTLEVDSHEFEPISLMIGVDRKPIASDGTIRSAREMRVLVTLPTTGTYTVIVASVKPKEMGRYQLQVREITAADMALAEAERLNQQVEQLDQQGKYGEAIPLAEQALAIRRRVLGERHPDVAAGLNSLALLYQAQGRYAEAEPLYQRSLQIAETQLGKDHPNFAISLNNLAGLYRDQGRYAEAEPLYQRSLQIRETQLGKDHPDVALSLNNLAVLYRDQGRYAEAEPLFQRSLQIRETQLGKDHPNVATSLNNLALLYQAQGRYAEAEPLFQRSLQIIETQLGKDHPNAATSLNNLAVLYRDQGRYAEAEPLFRRSLQIRETQLGQDHPNVATSLNSLALLYQAQGRYAEAEPLFQRSLQIRETQLGKDHSDVATSLNNLAAFYQAQGRYAEAEPLFQRSLQIMETQLGKDHPNVADSLNNLAFLYHDQGRYGETIALLTQGLDIQETNLTANLVIGAEAQKRDYITTLQGTTNAVISLHLQQTSTNPAAARLALTTALRRKGRILDALSDNLNRLRQNLTPADQKLLDQLTATRTQLATLYYGGLGDRTPEQYRTEINILQQQATRLEADLNNRSAGFRSETQPITLEAVQQQIPADTALVELVRYEPFDPKAKRGEQWGTPRYAAYTLTASGTIQAVDLGEAAPIDQLAAKFRTLLQRPNFDPKPVARQLDAVLMQPIRQKLGNTRNLLISPDSYLNLIPFAALVDEQNRYLVETYAIAYLSSGRDLLRLQTSTASVQPSLILANPDYENPGDPNSATRLQQTTPIALSPTSPSPSSTRSNSRSTDIASLKFDRLPGTAAEAAALAPKLPNAIALTDNQATENVLQQVQSPRILHIATHGFFLQDLPQPTAAQSRGLFSDRAGAGPVLDAIPTPGNRPFNPNDNPLLRSGLALAGFNPRKSGNDDGVLTALEASNLNLRGTQLVVLSACETGIGDIANGEGVYGLRRAFTLAGAETQVISLWKVSDDGTKDLMVKYYDRLLQGLGRSDALLQTQREFLNDPQYRHPFYWASFIPSGNWRPLR